MFNAKQAFIRTFVFLLIVLLDFGLAQEYNWSANLRFRARTDKSSDVDWQKTFATITETRSRLGLDVVGENASAKFILQDSRFLGNPENNSGTTNIAGSPFFHQAYFTFSNLKIPFFDYDFVKIGRFELALGNQRLIAKNNWNNIGRSFEGFLGKDSFLSGELLLMHLFINETMTSSHDDQNDAVIDGVYWKKNILSLEKNSVYELYFINFRNMNFDSLDDPLVSYNNIGTRIDIKKNNFVLESEFSFQSSTGTSSKNKVSATLLSFNLGYKPENMRFLKSAFFGLDQISGDDTSTDIGEGFSKEFGARHKHHGYYDYTSHQKYFGHHHEGLKEINFKANVDLFEKTNLLIALHNFKSGVGNTHYGNEADLILKTKHNKEITSEVGSVFYFPDQGNKKTLPFFYLMITANF